MTFKKTLPALAAAGALAIAGCGDDESGDGGSGAAGNGTDRAFVAAMIPHHESAIEMAKIAQQRGESAFVKKLAGDIISSQGDEIATMRREDEALDTAGVKPGSLGVPEHMTGMDDDPAELKDAEPFDAAFMEMMIPHHLGAIEMAKAEIAKGADPELEALAEDIIEAQEREVAEMRQELGTEPGAGGSSPDEHGGGHSG
jgi:uncharacterized protein (DUF305 family)